VRGAGGGARVSPEAGSQLCRCRSRPGQADRWAHLHGVGQLRLAQQLPSKRIRAVPQVVGQGVVGLRLGLQLRRLYLPLTLLLMLDLLLLRLLCILLLWVLLRRRSCFCGSICCAGLRVMRLLGSSSYRPRLPCLGR
jgi:hypothetical protein